MIIDNQVEPVVNPQEEEFARSKLMEIRFDCLVRMYDCGFRSFKVPTIVPFFNEVKYHPPQWFRKMFRFTLEEIKHSDPYVIGKTIQDAYRELESHIENYEKNKTP